MNEAISNNAFPYLDILFIFIFLAVVGLFYFVLRSLVFKFLISKEKPAGLFLSRLYLRKSSASLESEIFSVH